MPLTYPGTSGAQEVRPRPGTDPGGAVEVERHPALMADPDPAIW